MTVRDSAATGANAGSVGHDLADAASVGQNGHAAESKTLDPLSYPRLLSPMKLIRRCKFLFPTVSILGLICLSYVLGAAVMFFDWPSKRFLHKAFVGASAWFELKQDIADLPVLTPEQELHPITLGNIDRPEKTFDGFTLYMMAPSSKVFLVNMRGEVVHTWSAPFSKVWPNPTHLERPVEDAWISIFGGYLYPNGDLLAVYHGMGGHASFGYGLAKIDKDSKVIWKYTANAHHDVDVADDGTIYALVNDVVYDMPKGLEYIPTPGIVDYVVVLSAKGQELKKIPLLEAFRDSPYAPLLSGLQRPGSLDGPISVARDDKRRRDVFHTNHVEVLSEKRAKKFRPLFKAGQVLISMRHLDAIAVLDPVTGTIVWAARGPWKAQHDPRFLDNGRLLIFDNLGSPQSSRVLEYDPLTQGIAWSYPGAKGTPFVTSERGMNQRLPNGNTLIVNSDCRQILEVTASQEVVWSCTVSGQSASLGRRYGPKELTFLKTGQLARP
jgi:hypothetical protein